MLLILLSAILCFLCCQYGDWKNWRLYYPTCLFYVIGVITENIVTEKKQLWHIECFPMKGVLADYYIAYVIFPFIIILFLSNYPKTIISQVKRLILFVFSLSFIEYIGYFKKHILLSWMEFYLVFPTIYWNVYTVSSTPQKAIFGMDPILCLGRWRDVLFKISLKDLYR